MVPIPLLLVHFRFVDVDRLLAVHFRKNSTIYKTVDSKLLPLDAALVRSLEVSGLQRTRATAGALTFPGFKCMLTAVLFLVVCDMFI